MNRIYRIIPPEGLPPMETFATTDQAHEYFMVTYKGLQSYQLQECVPAKIGDLLAEPTVIGIMRERAAELGVDTDFSNDPDEMAELVLMLKAAANEWAELRKVDINGYITIGTQKVQIEEA